MSRERSLRRRVGSIGLPVAILGLVFADAARSEGSAEPNGIAEAPDTAINQSSLSAAVFIASGVTLFDGDVISTSFLGVGGEKAWSSGFGVALDVGYLAVTEELSEGLFVVSPGVIYRFGSSARQRTYVRAGYSLWSLDGAVGFAHVALGIDVWKGKKLGFRLELRDQFLVQAPSANLLELRLGLLIR